jgi:RNA polymerase sigma-70 factor (ECF subfamily)
MCFHTARFEARVDSNERLVVLEEQDRRLWNNELISQGMEFLLKSATSDRASAYHLEAAISAEHCLAENFQQTNWTKIHGYYTSLAKLKPSSVIQLNLAILEGKKEGPWAAIAALHELEQTRKLDGYYLLAACLGEFYSQVGKKSEALAYFAQAKALTKSQSICTLLDKKIALCT